MKKVLLALLLIISFYLLCTFPLNPIDPDNPDYKPPSFIIDKNVSDVSDGDTVQASEVTLVLEGNMGLNQFRWRFQEGEWSEWGKQDEQHFTILLTELNEPGKYIVEIENRYNERRDVQTSTITVYRAKYLFSLTYSENGASNGKTPIDDQEYQTGAVVTVAENNGSLIKTSHTFIGWNTGADGDGIGYMVDETFIMGDDDVTLYAQWTEDETYAVAYNGNGNTDGTAPIDPNNYFSSATVTARANTGGLEKEGETFLRWNTEEDGSGISFSSGETFLIDDADITFYAQWTGDETYAITYDGNGNTDGTAPVDPNNYLRGTNVVIRANSGVLEKGGATFVGWNTDADGSGDIYSVGSKFTMNDAITLYAQWSDEETFTVTYNDNDATSGTVPLDLNNYLADALGTVRGNNGNLNYNGNVFNGWNTKADGSGDAYLPDSTFKISNENMVLFALWGNPQEYSVQYDGNGNDAGEIPVDVNTYEESAIAVVLGNNEDLSRSGYTFAGWNTESDESGSGYRSGEPFTMGSTDVTLYAVWTLNTTFIVTYNGNSAESGSVPEDSTNYEANQTVTVLGNTGNLVLSGSSFIGWNTKEDGSGKSYTEDSTFDMGTVDVTLYAQLEENQYDVVYNANGASGVAPASAQYTYTDEVSIPDRRTLSLERATFAGWNTTADGSGDAYQENDVMIMGTADVELFAQWDVITYTVTVTTDGNGTINDESSLDLTVEIGDDCPALTAASNTGYHFNGWTGDLSETENPLILTNVTTDIAIAATFKHNEYTVTFVAGENGKISDTLVQTVLHGNNCTALTAAATTANYHFANWSGGRTSTENPYTCTNVTLSMTITANFAIDQFTLSYAATNGTVNNLDSLVQNVDYNTASPEVTALPSSGYTFTGYEVVSSSQHTFNYNNPVSISSVRDDYEMRADFTEGSNSIPISDITGIRKGSGDPLLLTFCAVKTGTEDRTVVHFDIRNMPSSVSKAMIVIPIGNIDPGGSDGIFIGYPFAGNGTVSEEEFDAGDKKPQIPDWSISISNLQYSKENIKVDVTNTLNQFLADDADYISYNFRAGSGTDRFWLGSTQSLPNAMILYED